MPPLLALGVSPRSAEQRKRTRPVPGRRRVCPSSGIPGCAGTQARLWRTPYRCRCGSPPPPPCSPVRLARSTARRCSGRSPALPSPPRRSPFRWSLAVRHAQPAGSRIVTPPAAPRAHAHAHARGLAEETRNRGAEETPRRRKLRWLPSTKPRTREAVQAGAVLAHLVAVHLGTQSRGLEPVP